MALMMMMVVVLGGVCSPLSSVDLPTDCDCCSFRWFKLFRFLSRVVYTRLLDTLPGFFFCP